MKTETETLRNFCRAICESFENFPPDTCLKVWEAFKAFQDSKGKASEEDLRDIYEALVTGLTLNENENPEETETETVTLENGIEISVTENGIETVIEANDWGIEGAFGARLEIGTAFANRETALKAFEAVCKILE